jgi:hypothetical protein
MATLTVLIEILFYFFKNVAKLQGIGRFISKNLEPGFYISVMLYLRRTLVRHCNLQLASTFKCAVLSFYAYRIESLNGFHMTAFQCSAASALLISTPT